MNILCIDSPYAKYLKELGHNVLAPSLEPCVIYLPSILQIHNFKPDLVIQHERLSARVILGGVEQMPCPTVFISVGSHLNMFWHKYYGRLFDLVLTSHISFFAALPLEERLPQVQRFGPRGYEREFKNFAQRTYALSFCGVLNKHRPARDAMAKLLKDECGLYISEILPHGQMLDLFADTCMVPNESIADEVNFRLFEAASCGALVFSQNIGEDQDIYFKPGTEFETYEHGLELLEKIKFYKKHPELAEELGQAAWRRVQAEHLPAHRAVQLLNLASKASQSRSSGGDAKIYFWLAMAQLARTGSHPLPVEWFMEQCADLRVSPLVASMRLRLLTEGASPSNKLYSAEHAERYRNEAAGLLQGALAGKHFADSLDFNLSAAMASLSLARLDWAQVFWQRQLASLSDGGEVRAFNHAPLPDVAFDHYMAWGRLLRQLKHYAQVGFNYSADATMLPGSALECLIMAKAQNNQVETAWFKEMHQLCVHVPGFDYIDMAMLAELSLRDQNNWRYQLSYGLSSFSNFHIGAGLFEVTEARAKAHLSGELDVYNRLLEESSSSRYILTALYQR